jgi:hypothetical protein
VFVHGNNGELGPPIPVAHMALGHSSPTDSNGADEKECVPRAEEKERLLLREAMA